MSLSSKRMLELERQASRLASGARTFVNEALVAARRAGRPGAALELLRSMRGSPFASRPNERAALESVEHWLQTRLQASPALDDLLLELGWLNRFARIRGDAPQRDKAADSGRHSPRGRGGTSRGHRR